MTTTSTITNYRNIWLLVLLLAGCATLGLEPPRSTNDGIQYARTQVTALYGQVDPAVKAQSITHDQAGVILRQLDVATKGLDTASMALDVGLPKDAASALKAALIALTAAQAYFPVKPK